MTAGPVIAVSGPPGAGKSTLCRALVKRIGTGAPIEYDAFETMTRRSPAAIEDWLARGAPYDEIETPGLADALRTAVGSGAVVFETPLGRAHPETGPLIDISIWLDCPDDIALARKIAQFAASIDGSDARALAQFREWLLGYLRAYDTVVRPACAIQRERVGPLADLRLDALDSEKSHLLAIFERFSHLV